MSMGIIKNGEYQKCAGMTQTGELVMGASTIRTGSVETGVVEANGYKVITVTFAEPMPDANYEVTLDMVNAVWVKYNFNVTTKTKNGFVLSIDNNFDDASVSVPINYTAFKLFTVEELEDVENDVAALKAKDVIQSDTITLDSNFTGTVYATKRNDVTSLVFHNVAPVSKTGSSRIATLSAKYRPAANSYLLLWTSDQCRIVNVLSDGGIDVGGAGVTSWFNNDTAWGAWGSISYPNAD